MTGVKPLVQPDRSDSRAPQPKPYPKQLEKDEEAVRSELLDEPEDFSELETGEELIFLRNGYQTRYLKRLRRGRYSIGDHLDLHAMNESTASKSLLEFVDEVVDDLGSRSEINYITEMMQSGTGADRQLDVYHKTNDLTKVVDYIIEQTAEGVG